MGKNKLMSRKGARNLRIHFFIALMILLLPSSVSWALNKTLGEIQPGEYHVTLVSNHLPATFKSSQAYWDSLQKVELEIADRIPFSDVPNLGMKQPYIGEIVLGDTSRKFGVIVDLYGEEKRLYVDTDGDGSFQGEPWHPLLNQWFGLQIYSVESPEPLELMVPYKEHPGESFPLQISVSGLLNKPGAFYEVEPYLRVLVHSWFLGKLTESGSEKLVAIVDRNNNGCYNDKVDALYVDYNDDGFFADEEMILHKSKVKLKIKVQNKSRQLTVNWGVYPDKVVIGGK